MNTMKSVIESIFLTVVFVFSMITLLPVYGQETITTNSITDKIKTISVQIKNTASEVVNNSTGEINQTEAKNTLNQLGEAAKKNSIRGS